MPSHDRCAPLYTEYPRSLEINGFQPRLKRYVQTVEGKYFQWGPGGPEAPPVLLNIFPQPNLLPHQSCPPYPLCNSAYFHTPDTLGGWKWTGKEVGYRPPDLPRPRAPGPGDDRQGQKYLPGFLVVFVRAWGYGLGVSWGVLGVRGCLGVS